MFRKSRRAKDREDYETWVSTGISNTLNTFDDATDVRATNLIVECFPDPAGTLTSRYHKGVNTTVDDGAVVVEDGVRVRRLTPLECERLQGFPDGWTEPAGSDSARYKALGNAVAVPCAEWVLRRLAIVAEMVELERVGLTLDHVV